MKKYLLSIALLAAAVTGARAQSETTSFDVDGIKVIFKPTQKNIINARLYFRAGVADYPAAKAGIETFALEAASQCGSKKYPGKAFKELTDKYSIVINGSSEQDYGYMQVDCLDRFFDNAWDMFSEAVMSPVFDQGEVQILRSQLIAHAQSEQSSPDERIDRLVMENGFEGTPYATNPAGTEETLNALNPADLQAYYTSILNKNRVFLVVVGKVNKEDLVKKIHAAFANMPAAPFQPVAYNVPAFNDNKVLIEKRDIPLNYIGAIMNAPRFTDHDFVAFRMGMGAFSGFLFNQLRTNMHLSYAQGAHVELLQMPYAEMYVSTPQPKEAVRAMAALLKRVRSLTLSDRGLKEMKSEFITGNYMKQQNSSAVTKSLGLAEILGGWQYEDQLPALVDAVTGAQINSAFNKYIIGLRWSYLGSPELADQAGDSFKQTVN